MSTAISFGPGTNGVGQANITLSSTFALGESTGSPFNYDLKNVNSPQRQDIVNLSSGANTITCPTSPLAPGGVVIIPPSGNSTGITLKGVSGDTGVAIAPAAPTMLLFPTSPPASFVLTAAGIINSVKLVWI